MSFGLVLIIGKAAIWLLLPAAIGIWELRRHRKMMARERVQALAGNAMVAKSDAASVAGEARRPRGAPTPVNAGAVATTSSSRAGSIPAWLQRQDPSARRRPELALNTRPESAQLSMSPPVHKNDDQIGDDQIGDDNKGDGRSAESDKEPVREVA